jgi:hypothetical protein
MRARGAQSALNARAQTPWARQVACEKSEITSERRSEPISVRCERGERRVWHERDERVMLITAASTHESEQAHKLIRASTQASRTEMSP